MVPSCSTQSFRTNLNLLNSISLMAPRALIKVSVVLILVRVFVAWRASTVSGSSF